MNSGGTYGKGNGGKRRGPLEHLLSTQCPEPLSIEFDTFRVYSKSKDMLIRQKEEEETEHRRSFSPAHLTSKPKESTPRNGPAEQFQGGFGGSYRSQHLDLSGEFTPEACLAEL